MSFSASRAASQSPARLVPISHHPSLHRVRHHVRHRCSGNRAPPAALLPAPVQAPLRTPAGITPRTAACIAVRTTAAHTPRRLPRASRDGPQSPSLIYRTNAIRTPFGASFITPERSSSAGVPSVRLSFLSLLSRRHRASGLCRIERMLLSIHSLVASLSAQGCACPTPIYGCMLPGCGLYYGVLRLGIILGAACAGLAIPPSPGIGPGSRSRQWPRYLPAGVAAPAGRLRKATGFRQEPDGPDPVLGGTKPISVPVLAAREQKDATEREEKSQNGQPVRRKSGYCAPSALDPVLRFGVEFDRTGRGAAWPPCRRVGPLRGACRRRGPVGGTPSGYDFSRTHRAHRGHLSRRLFAGDTRPGEIARRRTRERARRSHCCGAQRDGGDHERRSGVNGFGRRAHIFSSNAERGAPDWRMIESSVPVRSSR